MAPCMLDFLDPRKVAAKKVARMVGQKYHSGLGSGRIDVVGEVPRAEGAPSLPTKHATEAAGAVHDRFTELFERELNNYGLSVKQVE